MLPGDLQTLGPVQIIPQGLMGLLQLKQTGLMPGWLAQSIQPTIDLRDWYFQSRRVDEFTLFNGNVLTSPSVTARGVYAFSVPAGLAQVPGNQLWYVEHFSVFGGTAAVADVASFAPLIMNAQQNTFQQLGLPYIDLQAGTRQRNFIAYASRPFWANPSDIFGLLAFDMSTAGIAFQGRLRVTVLPI